MSRFTTLAIAFFLLAPSAFTQVSDPALPGGEATFEGLGDLPGDSQVASFGHAVSGDGSAVSGRSWGEGYEPFLWENGTMISLGDLPGGGSQGDALGLSADGSVVVGQSESENGFEAFRWEDSTITGLGYLPGGTSSFATGVSSDGSIVVGGGASENGNEAFRWESGTMTPLGDLDGGFFSSAARDVSADGSVIVGAGSSTDGTEAFRWENSAMTGLGDLPGGSFLSHARAVSADGATVVGYSSSENGVEAFRWEGGTIQGLGDLPGGNYLSLARGVSADGAVVVGYSNVDGGNEAFIWTAGDGMRNLKEVLENDYGLDLTGWTLRDAYDISDDGTVIVGDGLDPDGKNQAWRADLDPPAQTPAANISPASFTFEVPAGDSASDVLNIGNLGDAALDWSIAEAESGLMPEAWSDGFDAYATGSQMHGQGGWKGWFNDEAAGALVSDAQANNSPHSVDIVGASDLIHEFDEYTINAGQWTVTAWQFIPDDFTGTTMFIMLNSYDDDNTNLNWSTQVEFNAGTGMVENAGSSGGTMPLVTGEWVELRTEIDLNNDTQDFYYNDSLLYSGTWTDENTGDGALTFDTIDLFANNATSVYYDDLSVVADVCASPSDVAWLSATPDSASTAPDGSETVDVMVDASTVEPGADYEALLCVTTNDPNVPLVEIPVSMTIPGIATEASPDELADILGAPSPNPVHGTATFTIAVEHGQNVTVEVFDVTGRRIQTLYSDALTSGMSETLTFDAATLPPGVYVIRATGEEFVKTRRVTVVR